MSRSHPWINGLLVGLLAAGLSAPAFAQSVPFPTYHVGANQNGSQGPNYPSTLPNPWVVGNGQIITPAGTPVYLGIRTRAKAIALNPTGNHTAAVLQMGPQAVTVFNTQTGAVLQNYIPFSDSSGGATGITYTPDGKHLLFSQDSSYVAIANVSSTGLLTDDVRVSVPLDLTHVTCFPNSPPGTTGTMQSHAAKPFRTLPIRPASRSRRMAIPLTSSWTTTIR